MSDPIIVTGCQEPIFGISETCPPRTIYYSVEQSGSCSGGDTGGPFIIPSGKFTSIISQEDADAPAISLLASLIDSKCIPAGAAIRVSFRKVDADDRYTYEVAVDGGAYIPVVFSAIPGDTVYTAFSQFKYRASCASDAGPDVGSGAYIEPFENLSDSLSIFCSITATGTWTTNGSPGDGFITIQGMSEGGTPTGPFLEEITSGGPFSFSASGPSTVGPAITGGYTTSTPVNGTFTDIVLEVIVNVV